MLPARRKKGGQMLRFRDRGGAEDRRNSRTDHPFERGENTPSQHLRYAEQIVFAGVIAAESGSTSASVCRKTCTSIGWGRFLLVKKKAEEKNSAILKVPFSPSGRFLILAVACPKEKRCVSECLHSATHPLACPAVACLFFRMKRQRFFPSAARKSRLFRSLVL